MSTRQPTTNELNQLIDTLHDRFNKNKQRHKDCDWSEILQKLKQQPDKMKALYAMEITGGEPDVIGKDKKNGVFIFCDCSPESPAGRRSLCYDVEALDARKENKPTGSAKGLADGMGIELLDEQQYRTLQALGPFDQKTSSWIATPPELRKLGGALFGDHRYGRVFIYHNGVQSYYAARGFRGLLKV